MSVAVWQSLMIYLFIILYFSYDSAINAGPAFKRLPVIEALSFTVASILRSLLRHPTQTILRITFLHVRAPYSWAPS